MSPNVNLRNSIQARKRNQSGGGGNGNGNGSGGGGGGGSGANSAASVAGELAGRHALLVGGGAPELLGLFDSFARSLLLPKLAELGWTPRDSDGHLTRKLRGELICVLPNFCATDAAVVGEARRRFDAFVAAPEGDGAKELPAEYQEAVYKLVLKNGGEKEFDQLLGLFDSLTLNTARTAALACPLPPPSSRVTFAASPSVQCLTCTYRQR